jgi:hypothetical protein
MGQPDYRQAWPFSMDSSWMSQDFHTHRRAHLPFIRFLLSAAKAERFQHDSNSARMLTAAA